MTFEGFDAAPLIEAAGFTPVMLTSAEPAALDAATLDAALREAVRAERAAIHAEATLLDLWLERPGGANSHVLELPALAAGASLHALAAVTTGEDIVLAALDGAKLSTMRSAFGDEKEEEVVVKGTRPKTVDDDSDWAEFWGGGGGTGDSGGEIGGGGSDMGGPAPEKVADHTQDCSTDDGAAVQVAKHVMGTPPGAGPPNPVLTAAGNDWTQVEFGAIISRNAADGRFGALNDSIFSNDAPNFALLPNSAGSNAVGIWHNHPSQGGPEQWATARYPSSGAGRDDWDALQRLHDMVAPNDPNFDPSLWITGPDGVTREFKLSERAYYENLTEDQMKAGEGLEGKERTQSCG